MARDKTPAKGSNGPGIKTLAIRLEEAQHAQLSVIAQLAGRTLTDEIRLAVEHWIEQSRQSPEFAAQAETVIAEIDRDAEARRSAITALFGAEQASDTPASRRTRKPKTTDG